METTTAEGAAETRNLQIYATKAGMEGLDLDKINSIIKSASVGSKYYLHQQRKQKRIDEKIACIKQRRLSLSAQEIELATVKMDKIAEDLEKNRNLSHVIVHIDMDAFFAAVEMRNDPSLKSVPMAVGCSSMLSTSNYAARRFGVRAALPGFIGLKLCPELRIIPPNFKEYQKVSKQIEQILLHYDPDMNMASWDEGYLDITKYLKNEINNQKTPSEVVQEMRNKIFEATELTASAGIAPNGTLAKICSDQNKPNGQFELEFTKECVLNFIRKLRIRKVCGIGNVTEQLLNSLDIDNCGDLWAERGVLSLLFSSSSSMWFLELSLGIGSVKVKCDSVRKSMSVERTFADTNSPETLHQICDDLSEELSCDLIRAGLTGKTVTLKIKSSRFDVKTKAKTLSCCINDHNNIAVVANQLLKQEIKNHHPVPIKLRLMGVRMSNLSSGKQQITLDGLLEKYNNDLNHRLPESNEEMKEKVEDPELKEYTCPACDKVVKFPCLIEFNQHLDGCLSRNAIRDIVKSERDDCKIKNTNKRKTTESGTMDKFVQRKLFKK